jgi:hypothetical protein
LEQSSLTQGELPMRLPIFFAAIALAATSLPATAASLLTSSAGYTGPSLDLSGYNAPALFTAGPIALPGGITFSSTTPGSVVGRVGYILLENGNAAFRPIVGLNANQVDSMQFTFATPVSQFGGDFNYALDGGVPIFDHPIISAYDVSNNLIGSYDLFALAPISTPNAIDGSAFRGIDGGGIGIARFTMSGSYIMIAGNVPEPASWVMLIAGFGLVGGAMRRRAALAA